MDALPDVTEGGVPGNGENAHRRTLPRVTVLAIVVAFALQVAYVWHADEPYPAIMMPRFSWAGPERATALEMPVPEIVFYYSDSTTKRLHENELFPDIPIGHQSIIMDNVLSPLPASPNTHRASEGKLEPPLWLFPGFHLSRASRQNPKHVASLAGWLSKRARTLYPESHPVRCVVNWYKDSFPYEPDRNPDEARKGHVLTGSFEVDLHAGFPTPL